MFHPRRKRTPRLCGYSTRHFRRIINNEVVDDKQLPGSSQFSGTDSESDIEKSSARVSTPDTIKSVNKNFEIIESGQLKNVHDNFDEETTQTFVTSTSNSEISFDLLRNEIIVEDQNDFRMDCSDSDLQYWDTEEEEYLHSDASIESTSLDDSFGEENNDSDEIFRVEETIVHVLDENDDLNDTDDDDIDNQDSSNPRNIFLRKLRDWALFFHISLMALSALLLLLQPFINFPLPVDARTLLRTVKQVKISKMNDGEYHHFGLDRAVKGIIREFNKQGQSIKKVELMINIDGLPISKSGTESLWLILCSELNGDVVYPVGAFYGKKKPDDANEFLKQFVDELSYLCNNGFEESNVRISCAAIICDAPAKSFAFNLKGHTGYDSCSKCVITGEYIKRTTKRKNGKKNKNQRKNKGTVCFPGTKPFAVKTDEGFARGDYEEFDTGRETILQSIPNFGCISNVPLDYMHLVLLGVMKKLIKLWITGPLKIRLSAVDVGRIDKRMRTLRYNIPTEFSRKPRSMLLYRFWKATEFRTFLLYAGPVALQGIVSSEIFDNFILLHTAISVLVDELLLQNSTNIDACHDMFIEFVNGFEKIYGKEYVSHNVHNLLHICPDVKKYGRLDKYSSFRFENYMSTIKRMIRKGEKPLQQIAKRYSEREAAQNNSEIIEKIEIKDVHSTGPVTKDCTNIKHQFKRLECKSFKINCRESKNSFVILKDGRFGQVLNIVECDDDILLVIKNIVSIEKLYDNPDSRYINIHIGNFSRDGYCTISFKNILSKMWRIPSKRGIIMLPLKHS
ncbi:uncharacterized protein LOC127289069 [Leptopilina boulardi]|uniref:uncharacterized protein LOC127287838 n=1 Tax=Leptopilina boulardi TaxID=63433 RepID=UPI0021F62EDC|nr:uncharacterized protein LOC127287838 [Leptopilina boulardi]XP_051172787.1 uncharacterized protein LOC127289069 [Leptopilina boulardi]XP_051172788.1 uncharacterized protein LOC127289069 [Leptopilina boulardi]